jgi:hypothetical protein
MGAIWATLGTDQYLRSELHFLAMLILWLAIKMEGFGIISVHPSDPATVTYPSLFDTYHRVDYIKAYSVSPRLRVGRNRHMDARRTRKRRTRAFG